MLFSQIASNILLFFGSYSPNEVTNPQSVVMLNAQEQARWEYMFQQVNANQNFAFDRISQCPHFAQTPCGCTYQDFSTMVNITCSKQDGFIDEAILVSALPVMDNNPLVNIPHFPHMSRLVLSSQVQSCGEYCTVMPPLSFWTSLRLQLGSEVDAGVQCQHPCLCESSSTQQANAIVHCETNPTTRVAELTKLDLSNHEVTGVLSFSHLALPRGNPIDSNTGVVGAASPRVFTLKNNPNLSTLDFAPFNCVSVPMCDTGAWDCDFDLPNCRRDTDLGVWWTIFASLQQELVASTSCTRDDPCGTCERSVLRCEANRIVYLDFERFTAAAVSRFKSPAQFKRLSALRTLKLPAHAGVSSMPCFNRPDVCVHCTPVAHFCEYDAPELALRSLQDATALPTRKPTAEPTPKPTKKPTAEPTQKPTKSPVIPTHRPTKRPTLEPTSKPSKSPVVPTSRPSKAPTTFKPTKSPTTPKPTRLPTTKPSKSPTAQPTRKPSMSPTVPPTRSPTNSFPTKSPLTDEEIMLMPRDSYSADLNAWQDLYDALNGPLWFKCRTARSNPCLCRETEKQVSCRGDLSGGNNDAVRIYAIDLSDNGMTGVLTSQMINAFSALELIDMSTRVGSNNPNELFVVEDCLRLNLDCEGNPTRCMFERSGSVRICTNSTTNPPNIGPGEDTKTPTESPTLLTTESPTLLATGSPTLIATGSPTATFAPTQAGGTAQPTKLPTLTPTSLPTELPTSLPTELPTSLPTKLPTALPTSSNTRSPTQTSRAPSQIPSAAPTEFMVPTYSPEPEYEDNTEAPTFITTPQPSTITGSPTQAPITQPPTQLPTAATQSPTATLQPAPTEYPTSQFPTFLPSQSPTQPTRSPLPF